MSASGPLVLFDGHCRFCNGWVQFVLRHERTARYRFAPLQSEQAARILTPYGADASDLSTVYVLDAGRLYARSDAALHLARDLRRPWSWLRFLRIVPRWLRDAVYDGIGRRRYRLFGRSSYCMAAQADVRSRFLNWNQDEPTGHA